MLLIYKNKIKKIDLDFINLEQQFRYITTIYSFQNTNIL
jgi:hypothetical protein